MAQESTFGSSNNNHAAITCQSTTEAPNIDKLKLWASQALIPLTLGGLNFRLCRSSLFFL